MTFSFSALEGCCCVKFCNVDSIGLFLLLSVVVAAAVAWIYSFSFILM